MLSVFQGKFKDSIISGLPYWPQWHQKETASWGGHTYYNNLTFANFKSKKTYCGSTQFIFIVNPFASDYTPETKAYDTQFIVNQA
jgi:hypothetical protein